MSERSDEVISIRLEPNQPLTIRQGLPPRRTLFNSFCFSAQHSWSETFNILRFIFFRSGFMFFPAHNRTTHRSRRRLSFFPSTAAFIFFRTAQQQYTGLLFFYPTDVDTGGFFFSLQPFNYRVSGFFFFRTTTTWIKSLVQSIYSSPWATDSNINNSGTAQTQRA